MASYNDQFLVAKNEISSIVFVEPPVWTYCSCIEFAKWKTGHEGERWGNAENIQPNIIVPEIGDFVLIENHLATIIEKKQNEIQVDEGNWIKCKRTSRWLNINDKNIRGYVRI